MNDGESQYHEYFPYTDNENNLFNNIFNFDLMERTL